MHSEKISLERRRGGRKGEQAHVVRMRKRGEKLGLLNFKTGD